MPRKKNASYDLNTPHATRKKKPNRLRELLQQDRPTLGTHVLVSWPGIVEVIGHSAVIDYIEFSGEYAPYELYALENFCRAVDMFDHLSAMMKIDQEPRTFLGGRAVGSGFQGLLFADVRNAAEAEECVKAVRAEHPDCNGRAGVGMRRDVGYVVYPGTQAYVDQLDEVVLALMIEKKEAVENLSQILAVPGVDMVQFGPADYAMSIGQPGRFTAPEVQEAEKYTIEQALKMGVPPRVELHDLKDAGPYLDLGVKHFCVGWDLTVIYRYCREQGEKFSKLLDR